MTRNICLLGDSIFDNEFYVPEGDCVHKLLSAALDSPDVASLLAVDGAVIGSVPHQIERIPDTATHLVLSVGGNDALHLEAKIMGTTSESVHASLAKMKAALITFHAEYDEIIEELLVRGLPLTICTIYDAVPGLDEASLAGLAIINDIITRTAFKNSLDLIDLRILCNEPSDYSKVSPIEPSHRGGAKIADAILRSTSDSSATSRVFS